jgi:hypothetical protein
MGPADAAAFAALDLAPGAPWPVVQDAWRRLVKRHHPDGGGLSEHDLRRLLEANAAYAHLRTREHAAPSGRVARTRRGFASRAEVWNAMWDVSAWPLWMPGVRAASTVSGGADRRISLSGRWAGRHVGALLVLMTVMPPCRLTARLLDLRVEGEPVHLPSPPRLWMSLSNGGSAVDVELGVELPDGSPLPRVVAAALEGALLELLELAALSPGRAAA